MVDRLMSCEKKGWIDFEYETVTSGSGKEERKKGVDKISIAFVRKYLSRKAREINYFILHELTQNMGAE